MPIFNNTPAAQKKTPAEIAHEYALKHPVRSQEDYERAGNNMVLTKRMPFNKVYDLVLTTLVLETKEGGRFKRQWNFVATVRMSRTSKAVALNLLSKNYIRLIKIEVERAAENAGDKLTEKLVQTSHVIRLQRNLTEAEEAFFAEHNAANNL